jgi:hypothetical protein
LGALPALFVGLAEDPAIRAKVIELTGELSADQLDTITIEVGRGGFGGLSASARETCLELLHLACEGLSSRVGQGLEAPELLQAVEPIHDVAISGRTFADKLREMWHTGWKQNVRQYVDAMAVPTAWLQQPAHRREAPVPGGQRGRISLRRTGGAGVRDDPQFPEVLFERTGHPGVADAEPLQLSPLFYVESQKDDRRTSGNIQF